MQAGYVPAPTVNCLHRRCALFVAIASAVTMMDAQAACGPLAAGSYNVSQTCTPAAGLEASITTQPGTTIDTTAGSSILVRASNNNAAVTLSGTTINSNPATAANAVFSNVIGAAGTASLTVDGGINSVNLIGSGLDALAITNASSGSSAFTVTSGTTLNISNVVVGDEHDGLMSALRAAVRSALTTTAAVRSQRLAAMASGPKGQAAAISMSTSAMV